MLRDHIAVICIAWYIFIACVCAIGYVCLFLYYRQAPSRGAVLSPSAKQDIPNVTVIRPCKGVEPYLYECLASTFQQDYPRDKIAVHFCVSSRSDPAYGIIEKVVNDHRGHNARVFIEEEDDGVANGDEEESNYRRSLGPNPKIRNMSKAYREAGERDLVWILDCNIWVGQGVCARMVDRLCGSTREGLPPATPYKLVHHLPISVDVDVGSDKSDVRVADSSFYSNAAATTPQTVSKSPIGILARLNPLKQSAGGRVEELFLSSSHAKMYVAINTVAVAPCILGKSTMFRRVHLDYLTSQKVIEEVCRDGSSDLNGQNADNKDSQNTKIGIDYFSHNICEDHLIGDLLWKSSVPPAPGVPRKMRNHGLVYGDLAIQPINSMSLQSYMSRRVRWLRVRKFTVPVATLVEPGTESFLCSMMGAWGLTTCSATKGWAGESWGRFWMWWCVSILCWMAVDWTVYLLLHSGKTVETSTSTFTSTSSFTRSNTDLATGAENGGDDYVKVPAFARPLSAAIRSRRRFTIWLLAWLGRESLALPIWTWAIWGGTSVTWRERRFWVGWDMRVHEIRDGKDDRRCRNEDEGGSPMEKTNGRATSMTVNANMNAHVNGALRERKARDSIE
ncbi:uncharacterized protein A1O5_06765 [Cladophialophora psammophila CBS 110553]|uniref:Ceramide glucosyltransferase n=1 Tax=Cladophialophora psammophila CBS 110553 TaxID=1182543 RepID=W9XH55_9EURO|nr:uncharacterized protein A1O5_06765 [Cladophialophora psammophila CBS 110553]EXJ69694.1 hypothetical protein A1O5_06765 [Cladophialophora psammophila CBS 110553]